MLLTISLYQACCILLILTIWLCFIVQAETIVPATKDRFTNNLPDLSQLLCVPINTDELDKITSNMGTILSNTLETVAPLKLKKGSRKTCCAMVQLYKPILSRKKLVILSPNGEKLTWKSLEFRGKTVYPAIDRL